MPFPISRFGAKHALRCALIALAATAAATGSAGAVSARVKIACASDYFAYCRAHAVGSPGLRQCMHAAGPKLSKRCVNALVSDGEVSEAEVARKEAELR